MTLAMVSVIMLAAPSPCAARAAIRKQRGYGEENDSRQQKPPATDDVRSASFGSGRCSGLRAWDCNSSRFASDRYPVRFVRVA
jgi:hypothetical protein